MRTPHIECSDEYRSAIVEIPRPDLVEQLLPLALADGFVEKAEFHVTVLPSADRSEEEFRQYKAMLEGVPIGDIRLGRDTVYRVSKPKVVDGEVFERESIIVRVFSDDIRRVLGRLSTAYGVVPHEPFLHVTLFTKGDNEYAPRGIGIEDVVAFSQVKHSLYPPHPDANSL